MSAHCAHRLLPSTWLAIARICVNERLAADNAFRRCEGGGLSLGQHVTPPRVHRARDEVRCGPHETLKLFPEEGFQWKVALVLALAAAAAAAASASGAVSGAAIGADAAVSSATGTSRSTATSTAVVM